MSSMFSKSNVTKYEKVDNKNEIVKLYCDVPYKRKDEAKQKKAKWDMDKKMWFFEYDLNEFFKNKELHTYDFEPLGPKIINFNSENHKDLTINKVINNVLHEIHERWLLTQKEE
jgi:hypothetical protein